MKILLAIFIAVVVFLGLNYRQLYTAWTIRSETKRLIEIAGEAPVDFKNPAPLEDYFDSTLSEDFWRFSIINGAGKISHDHVWHSAGIKIEQGLSIEHVYDQDFENEDRKLPDAPAAGQYNNVTLIGGSGFQPTPSSDVVLQFSSEVSEPFYGTAGVIFQQVGTLEKNGMFVKPFDMFGFSVAGRESSINGVNGPLCYLALNWVPARVQPLEADVHSLHTYEIRLRWMTRTEWLGIVKVDETEQCQIPLPVFGPVEVHVWSDNSLVEYRPRRWWEMAPSMNLKLQNGGEKQFHLRMIRISEEAR
ncbi:MAG TPA: hypothetical protein VK900_17975 [Anaerolineales bacterium]|nr:hypothetical protein [Anaerolineales bacterium]